MMPLKHRVTLCDRSRRRSGRVCLYGGKPQLRAFPLPHPWQSVQALLCAPTLLIIAGQVLLLVVFSVGQLQLRDHVAEGAHPPESRFCSRVPTLIPEEHQVKQAWLHLKISPEPPRGPYPYLPYLFKIGIANISYYYSGCDWNLFTMNGNNNLRYYHLSESCHFFSFRKLWVRQ